MNHLNPDIAANLELIVTFIQENAAKSVFIDIEQAQAADNVARWLNGQQEAAQTTNKNSI